MGIYTYIHKIINSEFNQVILANIFSYFVAFSSSIFYVRLISPADYGLYSFAYNIISFFLLFNGLGVASGLLQSVSQEQNPLIQQQLLRFAYHFGLIANLGIGILIVIYVLLFRLPLINLRGILISMALFPAARLYIDVFQSYLRASAKNKQQAAFSFSNNFILLVFTVSGAIIHGLYGIIVSTYLAYVCSLIFSLFYYELPNVFLIKNYTAIAKKKFIVYSLLVASSNAFAGIIFIIDIIIIGYLIKSSKLIAIYKVATIIPFALNFIPNVIMNYYYPQFAKNTANLNQIIILLKQIRKKMLWFSLPLSIFLIISAKILIVTIFGATYLASVLPFQILSAGFWIIASFRTVNGNVLAALGKAKVSLIVSFIIFMINIVITGFLVFFWGIVGASCAVIIVYIIASLLSYLVLTTHLKKII